MSKGSTIAHQGIVRSITPDIVSVEILSQSACASCHAKSVCTGSESAVKIIQVPQSADYDCKVGDTVTVTMLASTGMRAVLICYVIPLSILLILLLTLLLVGVSEPISALVAICTVIIYYAVTYAFRAKISAGVSFKISK